MSRDRRPLKVLIVGQYPPEDAGARYRIVQYIPHLQRAGCDVTFSPFLTERAFSGLYDRRKVVQTSLGILRGLARRAIDFARVMTTDVVYVHRAAALVGPPLLEWFACRVARKPVVLDLDDATYLEQSSSVYGRFAKILKWPGKTLTLIRWADHVIAGNATIAAFAESQATVSTVLPTIVDVNVFTPGKEKPPGRVPVIGWIGSHTTAQFLESIGGVLQRLAGQYRFRMLIVGAGRQVAIAGVDVENRPWVREREVSDFQEIDIGVYPLPQDQWSEGKSGFKAIQYLCVGIPYVVSPVGVTRTIGNAGTTHFEARTDGEWFEALAKLLESAELRERMGAEGRRYALKHYSVEANAKHLGSVFAEVVERRSLAKRVAL